MKLSDLGTELTIKFNLLMIYELVLPVTNNQELICNRILGAYSYGF